MPTLYERDPNTGTMVPIIGSMTQAEADARYLKQTGGTMAGALFVPLVPSGPYALASKRYADDRAIPVGLVTWTASASIPAGWLWCSGSLVSRTTYAALFEVIGTMYGIGDGISTFATPNMQARLMVGRDAGNADYATLGAMTGAKDVALATTQVPGASGSFTMHNAGASTMLYHTHGSWVQHSETVDYRTGYENPGNPSAGFAYMNLGFGGGVHTNTQPTIILNAIVKT